MNTSNPAESRRSYSVRADAWSFGVLLLDMASMLRSRGARVALVELCRTLQKKVGVLTDACGVLLVEALFKSEDPHSLELFRADTPLGIVLRQCLRVYPKKRITMYDAARLLRGEASSTVQARALEAPSSDTSHGLSGPLDSELDSA